MALTERQKNYFIARGMGKISKEETDLVNYYELQWFLRQHVPTIEEVATKLGMTQVQVNYLMTRAPVIKALKNRGIPFQQHTQTDLTATQVAAAVTMMNFADTRSNEQKLDQLGINPSQYYAWQKDPQFKNLLDSLANQNLENIKPTAIGELTKKINAGDWNAVKYYLDATGALVQTDQPQMEQILRTFIEVIQRHVKDPATVMAISADLAAASQNRTLAVSRPQEITGEYIEDPELDSAKKVLGIT